MNRTQKVKPGDVLAIALPSVGRVAHARVYEEGTIGVYADVQIPGARPPIGSRIFLFQVGVYAQVMRSGVWPRIARDPFEDGEDAWPVPRFVQDALTGDLSIYERGAMSPAEPRQVSGFERVAAWDRQHVEDRISAAVRGVPCRWVDAPWPVLALDLSVQGRVRRFEVGSPAK